MTRLIVVRHGRSKANSDGVLGGQDPGELIEEGLEQARRLAAHLAHEHIDVVYCSDLTRCKQTLAPLLETKEFPVVYTKELREKNYGIFNGKSKKEFHAFIKKNNTGDYFAFKPPEGESFYEVQERVNTFLNKILKKEKGKSILLVTHNGTEKAIMCYLLKKEIQDYEGKKFHNASMSILEQEKNGSWKVDCMDIAP